MTKQEARALTEAALNEAAALFNNDVLTSSVSIEDEYDEDGGIVSINGLLRIGACNTEDEIYLVTVASAEENGEVDDELFNAEIAELKRSAAVYKERLDGAEDKAAELAKIDAEICAGIKAEIERAAKESRGKTLRIALTAAAIMLVIAAVCLIIGKLI